jgi:hypothetical protein
MKGVFRSAIGDAPSALTICSPYVPFRPMQDFADMAEAHAWTLQRLREMAGRLTEQAYLRASAAAGQDDEAQARWMLVFDRMARGLRLSMALEARLARERRWDDRKIERAIANKVATAGAASDPRRSPRAEPEPCASEPWASEPCESDRERDDDGLPETALLADGIERVKAIVEGAGRLGLLASPARAERQALEVQRAERARRAASARPPDEPWDVLSALDLAEHDADPPEPPWRGAG